MRIRHDESVCASLGMCELVAPDIFEVGVDGVLTVLDPEPSADQRLLVEQAVAACPTGALSIEG